MDARNCLLLAGQQYADLVIYELELSGHLFINIVNLVHRTDFTVNSLEIWQVFIEGALHFKSLILS